MVGNLISIFILSRITGQSFFDSLLIALTTIDTIFIFFTVIDYSLARVFTWPWPEDSQVWVYVIPKFTYPLNNMLFSCSVFLTVMIACERYLAVCHPIAYRQMNISSSSKQRLSVYLIPVLLVSILLNIPKFLETEFISQRVPIDEGTSGNQNNDTTEIYIEYEYEISVELSPLRTNPVYLKYYTFLTRLLVTGIIPISGLLFFNLNIYLGLKAARKRILNRPPASQAVFKGQKEKKKVSNETSFSLILLFIVAIFLCCQFPRLILNIAEFANMENHIDKCGTTVEMLPWFQCLTGFSHLLLIINASVNFLIYCSLNNSFKNELRKVCSNLILFKKSDHGTSDICEIPLQEIRGGSQED